MNPFIRLAKKLGIELDSTILNAAIRADNRELIEILTSPPYNITLNQDSLVAAIHSKNMDHVLWTKFNAKELTLVELIEAAMSDNPDIFGHISRSFSEIQEGIIDYAVSANNLDSVSLCISKNSPPTDDTLSFAARTKNVDMVKLCIAYGAKAGIETLDYACASGSLEIFELCLEAGAMPTSRTLTKAMEGGNVEIARRVFAMGVNPEITPNGLYGNSFVAAVFSLNHEMIEFALSIGLRPDKAALSSAVLTGDIDLAQYILTFDVDIDKNMGLYAIESNSAEMIDFVVNRLGATLPEKLTLKDVFEKKLSPNVITHLTKKYGISIAHEKLFIYSDYIITIEQLTALKLPLDKNFLGKFIESSKETDMSLMEGNIARYLHALDISEEENSSLLAEGEISSRIECEEGIDSTKLTGATEEDVTET